MFLARPSRGVAKTKNKKDSHRLASKGSLFSIGIELRATTHERKRDLKNHANPAICGHFCKGMCKSLARQGPRTTKFQKVFAGWEAWIPNDWSFQSKASPSLRKSRLQSQRFTRPSLRKCHSSFVARRVGPRWNQAIFKVLARSKGHYWRANRFPIWRCFSTRRYYHPPMSKFAYEAGLTSTCRYIFPVTHCSKRELGAKLIATQALSEDNFVVSKPGAWLHDASRFDDT